uniref:UPAR/Ly6 domain-containing protein n=1 Tax=Electrophorus electricus TaxID=8005 RepID=A0AAY5EDM1_ELEEL
AVCLFLSLAQALTCNKCPMGLVGICLYPSSTVCTNDTSNCYTATASNITAFVGFKYQGCAPSSLCNSTTNGTLLGATYFINQNCCNIDKCNTMALSNSAPYMQLSFTAALSAALAAFSWANYIY